jgi:hypothetical protein
MAFDVVSTIFLESATPFSARTYIIASRIYLIDRSDKVVGVVLLERVSCIVFFDGRPTGKCSVRRPPNRILRVQRAEGVCIVLVECLVILYA